MATDSLDAQYKVQLTQLQGLNAKAYSWVNGPADYLVQTDSGPVRTLLGIQKQALANRWVLRVIDVKTVSEAELYIDSYDEGQLFRVWGECESSPTRNGIYMKQDGHIVRVNLQEMNDVQDPAVPQMVQTKRNYTIVTEDDQWTTFLITDPWTLDRNIDFRATITGYAIDGTNDLYASGYIEGVANTGPALADINVLAQFRSSTTRNVGFDNIYDFFKSAGNPTYGNIAFSVRGLLNRKIRWVLTIEGKEYQLN